MWLFGEASYRLAHPGALCCSQPNKVSSQFPPALFLLYPIVKQDLRSQGYCAVGRGLSGLHWVRCNGRGPHFELMQERQVSSTFLPTQIKGTQGSLPQPEKDLKSPSSMRLEVRFPYHDSRAMTRSPSHAHRNLTSLAPQKRLPELPIIPREQHRTGAAARIKGAKFSHKHLKKKPGTSL